MASDRIDVRRAPVLVYIDQSLLLAIKNMQRDLIIRLDDPSIKQVDASRALAMKILGVDYVKALQEKKGKNKNNSILGMI